ncbi:hypothetical protein GWI33_016793 [Rhynchophorus ferrugineus]|uniref:Nucleotide exchange factor SIL1 n=1 Tax=Rhynchophorus ferrugineus TaxID=354439 RepID=A0A834I156_RHYFE|nr:hypothetical protein GWI33_016793 [Rhynchophorus ferrugineus]
MVWKLFLFTILLFSNTLGENDDESDSDEIFVPTKEWKVIKKGQKVPAGLHYRINLSTGKKEAKVNDDEESDSSKGFSILRPKNVDITDQMERDTKYVGKKKIEKGEPKKFRTMDEMKQELAEESIVPKSDVEVLQDLFAKFEQEEKKKHPSDQTIMHILRILNFVGHQVDNANEFVKMDGFKKIIYNKLNSTNVALRHEALKLFSTLAQNNPQVKIHILETGGVTVLLRLLNLDDNDRIKSSTISALSSSLRIFPLAQNKFVELGGLTIFTSLFKSASIKVRLKMVTLLTDFIVERQQDIANFAGLKYVDVEEHLYDLGWCKYVSDLLLDVVRTDMSDYDSQEKVLLAMKSMVKRCHGSYNKNLLLNLYRIYGSLSHKKDDDSEDYFMYLSIIIQSLLEVWEHDKDEL